MTEYQEQMIHDIRLIWDNDEPTYRYIVELVNDADDEWGLAIELEDFYHESLLAVRVMNPLADQILGYQGSALFSRLARQYWNDYREENGDE